MLTVTATAAAICLAADDNNPLAGYLMLGIVVIAVSLVMVATRRRMANRPAGPREVAREHIAKLREEKHVKDGMGELLVELAELSRQINAQIDTHFAKMERAIADADDRIEKLEALLQQTRQPKDSGTMAEDAQGEAGSQSSDGSVDLPPDPRYTRIYELADQGLSPVAIAGQVEQTTGEVELILNLRKSKRR